jgi:hypothetical protein
MKKLILLLPLIISIGCKDQVSSNSKSITNQDSISPCATIDDTAPVMNNILSLQDNGSTLSSVNITWDAATDNCNVAHYEIAIGLSAGDSDILSFTNIGDVTSYQSSGVNFEYDKDYYFSIRAVDEKGNTSALVTSSSWQIFNAKTLTNLVLWLDASHTESVKDAEGDNPGDVSFSNEISLWEDISGSSAVHSFSALSTKPNWDVSENAVRFNGSNQFLATADHADINLSTIAQRTLISVIKTSSNITNRQVIYEEGGTVRGINIYIEDSKLRCGFWNDTNDGDGVQGYTEVEGAIDANTSYVVSYIFDYSNFVDANGVDGTLECKLNKVSLGTQDITSRLFAHSGDIGLGSVNQHSYFHDGPSSSNSNYYFNGIIYEYLMYNSVHSQAERNKLIDSIKNKWSID